MLSQNPISDIIKHLTKCEASGHRADQIFEDWLDLCLATLEMMPIHARSLAQTGRMAEDPPEAQELWERIRKRYGRYSSTGPGYYFDLFAKAFSILLETCTSIPLQVWGCGDSNHYMGPDLLGAIYADYCYPSSAHGQYFTPWNVARLMAQMTIQNGAGEVHARLKEAAARFAKEDPLIYATMLASIAIPEEQAEEYFFTRVLPLLAPLTPPIMFQEPACGSGIMFLAAASQYPRWAIDWGLVRFYGQDIDYTCVKVCKINCMLYGLDPIWIKCALELSQAEVGQQPEPVAAAYQEAQTANGRGDQRRVKEIAEELRAGKFQQLAMFE